MLGKWLWSIGRVFEAEEEEERYNYGSSNETAAEGEHHVLEEAAAERA